MTLELNDVLLLAAGVLAFGGGLVIMNTFPLMMYFFPKKLKDAVMCPPYFDEFSAQTLMYFPHSITRTSIVSASIALPYYGKRYKGLGVAARKHSPKWYLVLNYIAIWLGLLPASLGLFIAIYLRITGVIN